MTASALTPLLRPVTPNIRGPGEAGLRKYRLEFEPGAEGEGVALHVAEVDTAKGGTVGFATDASMALSAERTLARFVNTMTETFAHLDVGLAIFDRNGALALFNPALIEMLDFEAARLARRPTLREMLDEMRGRRMVPETGDFRAWRDRLLGLLAQPDDCALREVWHLADERKIAVHARPHPHGSLAFVFDDISDRVALQSDAQRSADLLRETVDRLDEGLAVFGPDGTLRFANRAFTSLWDFAIADFGELVHARDVIRALSRATVESDSWDRLYTYITADEGAHGWETSFTLGSGRVLTGMFSPLADGARLCVFTDVTDRQRVADTLRERNAVLEAAAQMRRAVLDEISQRLRSPLNTIFAYAQMLARPDATDRGDYAHGIREAAGTLLDTLDEVGELASLQIEPLHDERGCVYVADALEMARELLRNRARQSGVAVDIVLEETGIVYLAPVVPALREIVFRMLAEALDAAPDGGTVTLRAQHAAGDTLVVEALCGGPGDPPAARRGGDDQHARAALSRLVARSGGQFEATTRAGWPLFRCHLRGAVPKIEGEVAAPGAGALARLSNAG